MIRKKRGKDMEEEKEMLLPRSAREGARKFRRLGGNWGCENGGGGKFGGAKEEKERSGK